MLKMTIPFPYPFQSILSIFPKMTYIYSIYTTILVDICHLRNNGKDGKGGKDENTVFEKRKKNFIIIDSEHALCIPSFP